MSNDQDTTVRIRRATLRRLKHLSAYLGKSIVALVDEMTEREIERIDHDGNLRRTIVQSEQERIIPNFFPKQSE